MLKRDSRIHSLKPFLLEAQGIHWSHQRLLAAASQISMLVITIVLITNVIITLGERRLQDEWATQRYSELQTVGTLLADKVSFQQFRTQVFAKAELLNKYLSSPTLENQESVQASWEHLSANIPELLGIALFDANGQFKFATDYNFGSEPLPPALLGSARNMGGNEIYTSPLEFSPVDATFEPYMYQLAWLENPDQSVRGYLVTYNAMLKMLEAVKPAFSSNKSPLMLFDTQGLLYAGPMNAEQKITRLPDTLGGSLKQTYPEFWRQIATSNFGQYHDDVATYVYLKVELTTQYETRREYFLVSSIEHELIAAKFSQWQNILIIGALALTLLATAVIVLSHFYMLEQRARQYSIELANGLFNSEMGCIIVNENGRVVCANPRAAQSLMLALDELTDRSLQRILHLELDVYTQLMNHLKTTDNWAGEIDLSSQGGGMLRTHIRKAPKSKGHQYLLITFEDISELTTSRNDAFMNQLLAESAVAVALTDAKGQLIRVNQVFDQLMRLNGELNHNLTHLLDNDLENQWQRITQQIAMQGQWQGQILSNPESRNAFCFQATLKGHLDVEGDVDYIICTLEQAMTRSKAGIITELVPHRNAILVSLADLERYFKSLPNESRQQASMVLVDISPEGLLSHMSDIGQLEKRQQNIEMQLLLGLPTHYQMAHWQLGKLVIILPNTDADSAHKYALDVLHKLTDNGLGEGISLGIACYQTGQTLEQFLSNAELALKRAKQNGEQNIGQAFTRQLQ